MSHDHIYYIKLKTGEELLGIVDPRNFADPDLLTHVWVEQAIIFSADDETGSTFARYWIAYSDTKDLNIAVADTYFMGLANANAKKFYKAFQDSVTQRMVEEAQAEEAYEGFSLDGMSDDDLEQMMTHGVKTRH